MAKALLRIFGQSAVLGIGVIIGICVGPRVERRVMAQTQTPAQPSGPRVITLQSYSTQGAMGANVILAHNLQADIAVVNGYDLIKIDQKMIDYLARLPGADQKSLSEIVSSSRAQEIYQLPR